jgi:hypothetical protein
LLSVSYIFDEETNGSYPFVNRLNGPKEPNGLNGLKEPNGLNGLAHPRYRPSCRMRIFNCIDHVTLVCFLCTIQISIVFYEFMNRIQFKFPLGNYVENVAKHDSGEDLKDYPSSMWSYIQVF